jgi:urease accessory protein
MKNLTALLALAVCAAPALAHPGGHDSVLAAGLLHPLTGLDHVLALAAAGLWSARQARGVRLPPVFLAAMLLGAAAGMAGYALPGLETGIAATVLAAGLLLAAAVQVPAPAAMALFAVFAALHGNAHGLELPAAATAGFMAGSALLLAAGRWAGARASAAVVRMAGAGVAVAGVLMLA